MKTIETWLPEFPGFYGTWYEPSLDNEAYELNSMRNESGVNDLDDTSIIWDHFDNSQYEFDVAEQFTEVIAEQLKDFVTQSKCKKSAVRGNTISEMILFILK